MAQVQEIVDRYQDLQTLGVKVLMISPQSDEYTQRLAAKFDVPVEFLVDEGNAFAREIGIAVANGVPLGVPGSFDPETVMPTLIVTNAIGTIIFSDQTDNYRVRPDPDVFLAILRRSGAIAE
jgi:peroxiredoxin